MSAQVFELKNQSGSRALISSVGCALMSLEIVDDRGETVDVVLGYDEPDDYLDDPFYLGVVVGRCAGRIPGGKLRLEESEHELPVGPDGNHLHGGSCGLGKRIWQELPAPGGSDASIELAYSSPAGEEGYPGNIDICVRYSLGYANELSVQYRATSDQPTVFSPTQHSYFNLAGHASGDILGHELWLDADSYAPLKEKLIPELQLLPCSGTAMDFSEFHRIGSRIEQPDEQLRIAGGYDHSFALCADRDWQTQPVAVLREPLSRRQMAVFTDRPGLHFYSGNMLGKEIAGKAGASYDNRCGLCLETQHLPASVLRGDWRDMMVGPTQPFLSETRFAFSRMS